MTANFLSWIADCWPWPQSRGSHGYPQATDPTRPRQSTTAHRAMFITVFGWVPEEVHHVCENGKPFGCVNPFHLDGLTRVEHGRITAGVGSDDTCQRGHNNWYIKPNGRRSCRVCKSASNQRSRMRKKAAA